MSASIAATAVITAVRAALNPRMATERPAIPSLALRALSMKATASARGRRTPNTTAKPRIWFSKVTRWPTSFLRAMISERDRVGRQRLHVHGLEEASAGQMRQPSRDGGKGTFASIICTGNSRANQNTISEITARPYSSPFTVLSA
jgi:hypothetical protein